MGVLSGLKRSFAKTDIPYGRYVFLWGALEENAGGMTRSMLARACMLYEQGMQVDVLLGARGKKQLDAVQWWKNIGYASIDKLHFVTLEHFLESRFANNSIKNDQLPQGERDSYNGTIRLVQTKGDIGHTDNYIAANGFVYMVAAYGNSGGETSVILKDQHNNSEIRKNNFSEVREYFFSEYVLALKDNPIFVFNDPMLDLEPGFNKMLSDKKTIVRIGYNHGIGFAPPRNWNSVLNPRVNNNIALLTPHVDAFIQLTEASKAQFEKRLGPRNIFPVVPNTVDVPNATPSIEGRNMRKAVFIGRYAENKQPMHIIKAFELALHERKDISLDLYGVGPLAEPMVSYVMEHGLDANIAVNDYCNNPAKVYEQVAVSFLSSDFESQSLSIMESMSHGCPVISYDSKFGPQSLINNGENGYLVPWNNIEAFAQAILDYFNHVDTCFQELSLAAYISMDKYRQENYVKNWAACLQEALENKKQALVIDSAIACVRHYNEVDAGYAVDMEIELLGAIPSCIQSSPQLFVRKYTGNKDDYLTEDVAELATINFSKEACVIKIVGTIPCDKFTPLSVCVCWNNIFAEFALPAALLPVGY